jgi:septal ring factor EnvC (AmiA/AmiB activator)
MNNQNEFVNELLHKLTKYKTLINQVGNGYKRNVYERKLYNYNNKLRLLSQTGGVLEDDVKGLNLGDNQDELQNLVDNIALLSPASLEQKYTDLVKTHDEVFAQLEKIGEKIDELIRNYEAQIKALKDAKGDATGLSAQLATAKAALDKANGDLAGATAQLVASKADNISLKARIAELEDEISRLKEQLAILEAERDALRATGSTPSAAAQVEKDLRTRIAELERIKAGRERVKQEIAELKRERDALNEQIAELKRQIAKLQADLADANARIAKLQAQVDKLTLELAGKKADLASKADSITQTDHKKKIKDIIEVINKALGKVSTKTPPSAPKGNLSEIAQRVYDMLTTAIASRPGAAPVPAPAPAPVLPTGPTAAPTAGPVGPSTLATDPDIEAARTKFTAFDRIGMSQDLLLKYTDIGSMFGKGVITNEKLQQINDEIEALEREITAAAAPAGAAGAAAGAAVSTPSSKPIVGMSGVAGPPPPKVKAASTGSTGSRRRPAPIATPLSLAGLPPIAPPTSDKDKFITEQQRRLDTFKEILDKLSDEAKAVPIYGELNREHSLLNATININSENEIDRKQLLNEINKFELDLLKYKANSMVISVAQFIKADANEAANKQKLERLLDKINKTTTTLEEIRDMQAEIQAFVDDNIRRNT